MFGMFRNKPRGLFGGGQGIVATPEQEAESARIAKHFGLGGVEETEPSPVQGAFGIGGKIMPGTQPAPKPGIGTKLFGQGWEDKAFGIGGILQDDGGAAWESVQQRRQAPLIEQAKRENEYRDWVRKQQWERENPKPANNDTVADYNFWQSVLTPQEFETWKQNRIDPPRYAMGADGQYYRVDAPRVPTAPVGKLTPITGGGAPSGTGMFP